MSDKDRERGEAIRYLRACRMAPERPLVTRSRGGVDLAVVIPALAERAALFQTLARLAANPAAELAGTMVVVVVNNHRHPLTSGRQIQNNGETLRILQGLVTGGGLAVRPGGESLREDCRRIAGSALRLAFIDASSTGREILDRDGGVGTARKIGMDAALEVLWEGGDGGVIGCLDADTWVQSDYLRALRAHFRAHEEAGAVVDYAHRIPKNPGRAEAVACYELFLRYYVLGLAFAGSPYAFATIGSTMACTAEGYRAVRGMNRRAAAEDFHFLNKLAKVGRIGRVWDTTVHPSGRASSRVPFGTGDRIRRHLQGEAGVHLFYDPACFGILRQWLSLMGAEPDGPPERLLQRAAGIHPELARYLLEARFTEAWASICRNAPEGRQRRRQFAVWFDGLKTLKLIHHLSRGSHPPIPMGIALRQLLRQLDLPFPLPPVGEGVPSLERQRQLLDLLRSWPSRPERIPA